MVINKLKYSINDLDNKAPLSHSHLYLPYKYYNFSIINPIPSKLECIKDIYSEMTSNSAQIVSIFEDNWSLAIISKLNNLYGVVFMICYNLETPKYYRLLNGEWYESSI